MGAVTSYLFNPTTIKQQQGDVTDDIIQSCLKMATVLLDYQAFKGVPIDRIDTHALWGGGANALSLSGYLDR